MSSLLLASFNKVLQERNQFQNYLDEKIERGTEPRILELAGWFQHSLRAKIKSLRLLRLWQTVSKMAFNYPLFLVFLPFYKPLPLRVGSTWWPTANESYMAEVMEFCVCYQATMRLQLLSCVHSLVCSLWWEPVASCELSYGEAHMARN